MVVLPSDKAITEKISAQLLTTESPKLTVEICHPDVECDMSRMKPIVGTHFHKIGGDYDLHVCETEFNELSEIEKSEFGSITKPGAKPVPYAGSPATTEIKGTKVWSRIKPVLRWTYTLVQWVLRLWSVLLFVTAMVVTYYDVAMGWTIGYPTTSDEEIQTAINAVFFGGLLLWLAALEGSRAAVSNLLLKRISQVQSKEEEQPHYHTTKTTCWSQRGDLRSTYTYLILRTFSKRGTQSVALDLVLAMGARQRVGLAQQ